MVLVLGLVVFLSYKNSVIDTGWFILLAGSLIVILCCILFLYRCYMAKDKQEKKLLHLNKSLDENRQLIMNAALDAIISTDPYGIITFWNPMAEIVFGWTSNEVMGKPLYELIIPLPQRELCEKELADYRSKGESSAINMRREMTMIDRNGKAFPAECTMLLIRQNDAAFFCTFIRDLTSSKTTENELKEQSSEFRKLSSYLQSVREAERKHIAREVHDELGQLVSALKIDIDWMNARIASLEENEKKRLNHASDTLETLILAIRRMAFALRPSILDDFGLNATIEWQCREFQRMHGIECDFFCDYDDKELPVAVRTELFRIVQESLTNVVDHSEAKKVKVAITSNEGSVYVKIEDDGKGFDMNSTQHALGLIGLRERAASVHGTLSVESVPGRGTIVLATIPKR